MLIGIFKRKTLIVFHRNKYWRKSKHAYTHDYKGGDKVLILNRSKNAAELNCPTEGPYEIFKVYVNIEQKKLKEAHKTRSSKSAVYNLTEKKCCFTFC